MKKVENILTESDLLKVTGRINIRIRILTNNSGAGS
jgi:hypothetical protein